MIKFKPVFSLDLLDRLDIQLLKACEASFMHWAIICPDRSIQIVKSVFTDPFYAKAVMQEKEYLVFFNAERNVWELP